MVKWFTGCSAPALINRELSAAAATPTLAVPHGNELQVARLTHYSLPY